MLVYVFSDPALVEELREEVLKIVTVRGEGRDRIFEIDITRFQTECPLLVSCYQETTRLTNDQVSTRFIQADTILTAGDRPYLLKKGAVVQLPAGFMHKVPSTWGPNAQAFDPRRFLKPSSITSNRAPAIPESSTPEDKRVQKERRAAFMPFGGGKHLCPGRHFAFAEILGMVAAMVIGFQILDKDDDNGGGRLKVPQESMASKKFGEATGKPRGGAEKIGAKIVRREGMEGVRFGFKI
jgi:cytochrome P450